MNTRKLFKKVAVFGAALALASSAVMAQDKAVTLDDLLKQVQDGSYAEAKENKAREARFKKEKAKQAQTLANAKAQRTKLERLSVQKEQQFEANEIKVVDAQKRLKERLGTLSELFGHLTSAAGDMRSNFEVSRVSAQYPGREEFLDGLVAKMTNSDQLPSIDEIERLWFELQREMTESGRITTFAATVVTPNGDQIEADVLRVGSFNLVTTDGKYLTYGSNGVIEELPRQPDGRYLSWASDASSATDGLQSFGIDPTGPTGGSLLSALIGTPTLEERWHQGGYVGYAITAVGVVAILLAIWRMIVLIGMSSKVSSQLKSDKANPNNPLGRVLMVHEENPSMDSETLELKLSEAVLKEIPAIESYLNGLKIIAAVAPLMGLLGTVTGMIITFQAITIFGAGDPKAMAGGISGALITTVLGLLVAIPTVLMHTIVAARAKSIIHVLEEQSTGIIAEHTTKA
ncbi:MAG: MotA/TolQ/ExbB proton channel family protein [Pseudomonadales bacterium]